MKSSVALFYYLFVLFISWPVSESYDNSNIAIIEVPSSDLKGSDQKTDCELEHHDTDDVTGATGTDELTENQISHELQEIPGTQRRLLRPLKPELEISNENDFDQNGLEVPEDPLELVSNDQIYFNNLEYLREKSDVKSDERSTYPRMPMTLIQLIGPPIVLPPEYAIGMSNSPNTHLVNNLLNKRPSRSHISDQDLLEQLEHDSIMNNILPTMDAPFFRAAYPIQQEHHVPLSKTNLVAYFPEADGIPIPILLMCSPKITQGYQENLQVPLPYYNSHWYNKYVNN